MNKIDPEILLKQYAGSKFFAQVLVLAAMKMLELEKAPAEVQDEFFLNLREAFEGCSPEEQRILRDGAGAISRVFQRLR